MTQESGLRNQELRPSFPRRGWRRMGIMAAGVFCIFAVFILTTALPVAAYKSTGIIPSECYGSGNYGWGGIMLLIGNIIKFALGLSGTIALLMFFVGGYFWIFGGASESNIKKGKEFMTNAVIGLLIVYGSWVGVNYFVATLTTPEGQRIQAQGLLFGQPWNQFARETEVCIEIARSSRGGASIPEMKAPKPAAPAAIPGNTINHQITTCKKEDIKPDAKPAGSNCRSSACNCKSGRCDATGVCMPEEMSEQVAENSRGNCCYFTENSDGSFKRESPRVHNAQGCRDLIARSSDASYKRDVYFCATEAGADPKNEAICFQYPALGASKTDFNSAYFKQGQCPKRINIRAAGLQQLPPPEATGVCCYNLKKRETSGVSTITTYSAEGVKRTRNNCSKARVQSAYPSATTVINGTKTDLKVEDTRYCYKHTNPESIATSACGSQVDAGTGSFIEGALEGEVRGKKWYPIDQEAQGITCEPR